MASAFKFTVVGLNQVPNSTLGEVVASTFGALAVENTYGISGANCTVIVPKTPTGGGYNNYQVSESLDDILAAMNAEGVDDLTVVNNLEVGGDILVNTDKFIVDGATGDTTIDGSLDVAGATTLADTLEVTGASTLTGAVTATAGVQSASVARTATADGTGTGTIAAGTAYVTVTSADANNIIILPAPVVGNVIRIAVGATGFELRSSTPASIAINGGTGATAESAIPANTLVTCTCTSATTWICMNQSSNGTVSATEVAA